MGRITEFLYTDMHTVCIKCGKVEYRPFITEHMGTITERPNRSPYPILVVTSSDARCTCGNNYFKIIDPDDISMVKCKSCNEFTIHIRNICNKCRNIDNVSW